jgi:hypothetical protein
MAPLPARVLGTLEQSPVQFVGPPKPTYMQRVGERVKRDAEIRRRKRRVTQEEALAGTAPGGPIGVVFPERRPQQ